MRKWVVFALMLVLLPLGFATFPYNVDWLAYADKRLIYEINTIGLTNQDVYVVVDVDPVELQNYINRWADYCDPTGKYDWFWPTFTYASTYDNTQRMVKAVEYNNTQTFTVGSCGTVDIPTRYVLELGTLDGGSGFATYQHYIYAYLKYPYSDDFSDNTVGAGEYIGGTINLGFSSVFGMGNYIYSSGWTQRPVDLEVNLDTIDPTVVCLYGSSDSVLYHYILELNVDGNILRFFDNKSGCSSIEGVLRQNGFSGSVVIKDVRLYTQYAGTRIYYWWLIPESVYKKIQYG